MFNLGLYILNPGLTKTKVLLNLGLKRLKTTNKAPEF